MEETFTNKTFTEKLAEYLKDSLSEGKKVAIAKNKYLIENRDEILKAKKQGYSFDLIAEFATLELMLTDVPETYSWKDKNGDSKEQETKFYPIDISKFFESETETEN